MYDKYRQKKVVVLDVDGSLSEHTWRLPHITEEPKDWEIFYALQELDEPIEAMTSAARSWQEDYIIAIFTGRPSEFRRPTERWVRKQGIRVDFIFTRPTGDKTSMVDLKQCYLDKLHDWGFEVAWMVEDHPGVVEHFRSQGITVIQPTNHWIEYAGTETEE
jgi:hypothetical protein